MSDNSFPRPIEPGEVKIGQTVRAECRTGAYATIVEGVVSAMEGDRIGLGVDSDDNSRRYLTGSAYSWDLLAEAPNPAPAVGSRWRDPETGAEYVAADTGDDSSYVAYRCGEGDLRLLFVEHVDGCADTIARLIPIPDHGDGCSPWLWDPETDTGWVKTLYARTAVYVQVFGREITYGYIDLTVLEDDEIAARLRPWSERGQR